MKRTANELSRRPKAAWAEPTAASVGQRRTAGHGEDATQTCPESRQMLVLTEGVHFSKTRHSARRKGTNGHVLSRQRAYSEDSEPNLWKKQQVPQSHQS